MIHVIIPTLEEQRGNDCAERVMCNAGVDDVTVNVVVDDERRGWVRTTNVGLRRVNFYPAPSEYVLLLNDDCDLSEGWLFRLKLMLDISHNPLHVGFVGPSGACRTRPQSTGRRGDQRTSQLVHHLAGFCLLIHPQAVRLLDEDFTHYAAEVALQVTSGWRSLWVPGVYCEHELHAPHREWWERDQALLYEKYGGLL